MKDEHKLKFATIILAAGAGTRMRSTLPKVMHKLAGKPMINHVVDTVKPLSPEKIIVVTAPHMDSVRESVKQSAANVLFVSQTEQKGTGHAVLQTQAVLREYNGIVLVLYGDTPMINCETLSRLLSEHKNRNATISLLGMRPEPPTGYGRLVMNHAGFVERIVECKDATEEEKKLPWVWAGVMAFDAAFLNDNLVKLTPSPATGEYYLTALIEMATAQTVPPSWFQLPCKKPWALMTVSNWLKRKALSNSAYVTKL